MRLASFGTTASSIVALAVLAACSSVTSETPGALRHDGLQPLQSEVTLAVREIHGLDYSQVGEPQITLFLATVKEYGCMNFLLDATAEVHGREISVDIAGVREWDVCATAIGPATNRLFLPLETGEYALDLLYEGRRDRYELAVSHAAIELRPVSANGFSRPGITRAWRYPRLAFAYLCDVTNGGADACAGLRAAILQAVALRQFQFGAGGEVPVGWATDPGGRWRAEYFYYESEADFATIGALVRSFAARHPRAFFSAVNWRNESYLSWYPGG